MGQHVYSYQNKNIYNMEILVYILAGVATFFVMSFLMARFENMDYDDIFCVSLGCAFL